MIEEKNYKLINKSQIISTPLSYFFFSEVNPKISSTLETTGEYKIQSNVKETIFTEFIQYCQDQKLPNIQPDNISEFELLSNEFEIMGNIIKMYQKQKGIDPLVFIKNKRLKMANEVRNVKLNDIDQSYQTIINLLLNSNEINIYELSELHQKNLCLACKHYNVDKVMFLTKKYLKKNGLLFYLYDSDKTASIQWDNNDTSENGTITIPKSVTYQNNEYTVTNLSELAFQDEKTIKTVIFSDDSKLNVIERCSFIYSHIQCLIIPSSVLLFEKNWCKFSNLKEIKIIEKDQKNIKYLDENKKIILTKSNIKSDVFNIVLFAMRDIEKVKIPSFVKKIASYAFSECDKISEFEIEENSQLMIIETGAFKSSSLKEFIVPSKVRQIEEETFQGSQIKSIKFEKNSNLKVLEKNLFLDSEIESFEIPSSIEEIKEGWCCGANNLIDVTVDSENKNFIIYQNDFLLSKSNENGDFDIILFARRDIESATIPSYIKRIGSYSFDGCENLTELEFESNSKLYSIGLDSFTFTEIDSITIPKSVEIIEKGAFYTCSSLKSVKFESNSKLRYIGKEAFGSTLIENFTIPSSVYKMDEKVFTENFSIQKVGFSEESKLKVLKNYMFLESSIEEFSIPSSLVKFEKKWCCGVEYLCRIKISPKNDHFIFYKNDFILGKSDENSSVFDILHFARRNIVCVKIPSFIQIISPFAFEYCSEISSFSFDENSQLKTIGQSSFSSSSINDIVLPSSVMKIGKSAFNGSFIKKLILNDDSNLRKIGKFAFANSLIECLAIPPSVAIIKNDAFNNCNNLKIIEFKKKSNFMLIKKDAFDNMSNNTIIMIPNEA